MRAPGVIKTTLCFLLVAIAVLPTAEPAVAQDAASATTIFRQLNDTSIAIYQDAKRRFLGDADPVVIAGFSSVLIRQHGAEKRVGQTPAPYDLLKTVDHVPRSLWAALRPAIAGLDREEAWRARLAELRPRVAAALGAVKQAGLPPEAAGRGERTLRTSLGLLDGYLAQGLPSTEQLQRDMRGLAPAILADAADAARARLDAIDRDVRPWWDGLSQAERERTFVVVLGAKTARPGNLAYTYFVNLLGTAEDGHRVIYAEGIFDEKGADGILAQLVTDRRLSVDFFADERRMERDVLADGAEQRLMQLFGRLGTP
jgi:hypothetical protein